MSKTKIFEFWDYLAIGGALLIIIWALLKSFGIISSPLWVEMLPYIGGGISLFGVTCSISYRIGRLNRDNEIVNDKLNKLLGVEERFNKLENEHKLVMNGKLNIKH